MSPVATTAPSPGIEERAVDILRDLLAGALADYWAGVPSAEEINERRRRSTTANDPEPRGPRS